MAKAIMNCRVYLAEVDLSGVANAAAINLKTDIVECTAFADAYKDKLAGMTDVIAEISGFYSAEAVTGNPDTKMFNQLALNNAILSILTGAGAAGEPVFFFRPTLSEYNPLGGKVSEMAVFKLHGEGAAPLVKGLVLMAKAAKTLTGTSTPFQLGAVASGQKIYAAVHIFTVSGTLPTLDLILQSDNAEAFSDPANQITFSQKSGVGQDWQTKDGAVADDWWRLSYTIGGTLPSFTLAVVAGIV